MNASLPSGSALPVFPLAWARSILHAVSLRRAATRACGGDADAVRVLTREYAGCRKPSVRRLLVSAVTGNPNPAVAGAFCDDVLLTGDAALASLAAETGIAPQQAGARALFLFATGQIRACFALEKEHGRGLLRDAYLRAPEPARIAVCAAAKRHRAETALADILLECGGPGGTVRLSASEWEIVVAGLVSAYRYHELYSRVPEVPCAHALQAIRSLKGAGWSPGGMLTGLWENAVHELPDHWSYPDRTARERSVLERPDTQTRHLLFSPDGSLLVTSGYDGTLRIWDVRKGELLARADECRPAAGPPVFSPDGRFLATGHRNGGVVVRAIPSGTIVREFAGPGEGACPVAFSPDSAALAYGNRATVVLARVGDGARAALPESGDAPVTALAFSPDGRYLCGGDGAGSVSVWLCKERKTVWMHRGCTGRIATLAFTPDGTGIVAIPGKGQPLRIDAGSGACSHVLAVRAEKTLSASFSTDRRYLVTASGNDMVRIWQTSDGRQYASFQVRQKRGAACTAIVPEERMVITGGRNGILRIFRYGSPAPEKMFTGHAGWVSALAVSPDGKTLATAGWEGTTKLWNLPSGQLARPLPVNARTLTSLALSGDKKTLAAATGDGQVWLWEVAGNRMKKTLDAFTGPVTAIALNGDASLLACAGEDRTVRLWSTADNSMIGMLPGISVNTRALVFTPDGKGLLSGGWDGLLRQWGVPGCRLVMTCRGHTGVITALACSPDGTRYVSGGSDGTVRIWDAASGTLLATRAGDERAVGCVAVTQDSRLIAAGGTDTLLRLFRLNDGSPVAGIAGAPSAITGLAGTPGSDLLAASTSDGSVCYFSIARRKHIRNFSAHAGNVLSVAACEDGRVLASCGSDGTLRLWNMPESSSPAGQGPEVMEEIAYEARNNPSQQARRQWEFLHGLLALRFAHEICLFSPPDSVGEYDIGIVG